jgi:hypothetical protein
LFYKYPLVYSSEFYKKVTIFLEYD